MGKTISKKRSKDAARKQEKIKAKDITDDWTMEEKLAAYKKDPYLENYMLDRFFVE